MSADLIRERDQALTDRMTALELAVRYARQAGIDVDTLGMSQWVLDDRRRRDAHARQADLLESQRLCALGLAHDLEMVAAGRVPFDGGVAALAALVAEELARTHRATAPAGRRDLFGVRGLRGVA